MNRSFSLGEKIIYFAHITLCQSEIDEQFPFKD